MLVNERRHLGLEGCGKELEKLDYCNRLTHTITATLYESDSLSDIVNRAAKVTIFDMTLEEVKSINA